MLCHALRARHPSVFASSRWTICRSAWSASTSPYRTAGIATANRSDRLPSRRASVNWVALAGRSSRGDPANEGRCLQETSSTTLGRPTRGRSRDWRTSSRATATGASSPVALRHGSDAQVRLQLTADRLESKHAGSPVRVGKRGCGFPADSRRLRPLSELTSTRCVAPDRRRTCSANSTSVRMSSRLRSLHGPASTPAWSSSGSHQGGRRIPVVIMTLGGRAPFQLAFVVHDLEAAAQRSRAVPGTREEAECE